MNYLEFVSFLLRTNAFIHDMLEAPLMLPKHVHWKEVMKLMARYNTMAYSEPGTRWIAPNFILDVSSTGAGTAFKIQFVLPSGDEVLGMEGNYSERLGIILYSVGVSNMSTQQMVKYDLLSAEVKAEGSIAGWQCRELVLYVLQSFCIPGWLHRETVNRAVSLTAHIKACNEEAS